MRIKSLRLERYPFCARRCLRKKKKKLRELRNRWFTRLKLIVLVCFRTTMGLCGFNSIAPLDLVTIKFRVRSLASSSAFMFAPKPDPVRLESNASAWNSYDMQLQYFNINSQRFNSRLGSWQSASRLFSLLKYLFIAFLSVFLIAYVLGNHPKQCKFLRVEVFDKRCLKRLSEFLQKLTSLITRLS